MSGASVGDAPETLILEPGDDITGRAQRLERGRTKFGGDGRAVLWCFAHHCPVEDIVKVMALDMRDLFPPGHHRGRRLKLVDARRLDFEGSARTLANVTAALEAVGAEWGLELRTDCAHCGSPRALLRVSSRGVFLSCPGDEYAAELGYSACTLDQFQEALAACRRATTTPRWCATASDPTSASSAFGRSGRWASSSASTTMRRRR